MRFKSIVFIGTVLYTASPAFLQQEFNIVEAINRFSVELLDAINREGGDSLNIALSPLKVWTLLSVLAQGAFDTTADQLDDALRQPQYKAAVRDSYQSLSTKILQGKANEIEFESSSGIFTNEEFAVKQKFAEVAKQYYGVNVTPVNFNNSSQDATRVINNYVAVATRNRIPRLVNQADVKDAYLFMTSTMYVKGQWKSPFNRTVTQRHVFIDEMKNHIGEVNMMYQDHPFAYARIDQIKADVLELPYGIDDKYSMLILVPRGAQTVSDMLSGLTRTIFPDILAALKRNQEMFGEEDIHVYLPRFKIVSDFNLNGVIDRMGVKDVFDPAKVNLLGIFSSYLPLSRVIQKAEIEVDEGGASGTAGSMLSNSALSPVVKANRPFLYFIIQKESGTIIFAGKFSNPNSL